MTAQNYIDEFQRIASKKLGSGGEWLIQNIVGEQAYRKGTAKTISGLSAPNKHTLVIKLTHPTAVELKRLAMPFFSPVDPKFIKKVGTKAFDSTRAMGDGPFELKSINSDQVVMTKNPNYWMKDKYGNQLKAKQLLQKASVNPKKLTLKLYSPNQPDQMRIDQSIQQDLKNIGITVKIKATTFSTFLDVAEKGQAQMFQTGWIQDYPDAGDFLMLFETSQAPVNNESMYSNKKVDQWMKQASDLTNQTQRTQLFNKVTNQVMTDAPWVPLYYPIAHYAVQTWVHGWFAPAARQDPLKYIWINKSHSKG